MKTNYYVLDVNVVYSCFRRKRLEVIPTTELLVTLISDIYAYNYRIDYLYRYFL